MAGLTAVRGGNCAFWREAEKFLETFPKMYAALENPCEKMYGGRRCQNIYSLLAKLVLY